VIPESVFQLVTFGIAVLGAVLGVINTARAWRRDRVRIRVVPVVAHPSTGTGDTRTRLAIEVVNIGAVPVTVDQVGYVVRGQKGRRILSLPQTGDGGAWPRRLEPHSSVTAYAAPGQDVEWLKGVKRAFAKTSSGLEFSGTSPMLRWMVKNGRLPDPPGALRGHPAMFTRSEDPDAEWR
jgi:hypothetical protein